jgi:hypothetical protein
VGVRLPSFPSFSSSLLLGLFFLARTLYFTFFPLGLRFEIETYTYVFLPLMDVFLSFRFPLPSSPSYSYPICHRYFFVTVTLPYFHFGIYIIAAFHLLRASSYLLVPPAR